MCSLVSASLTRKNLMVDAAATAALAHARGLSESEAVRQAVAEALADKAFNAASRTLFSNRALRKTFSDLDHLRRVYGDEFVEQLTGAATSPAPETTTSKPPLKRRRPAA